MHPEAKNGEERKSEKIRKAKCNSDPIKSFVQDTADKVGISSSTISNVTNNSQPVINLNGDTIIYGANQETVKQHEEITRKMANQIFGYLHIKR